MSAVEFVSLVSSAVLVEATGGPDPFAAAGLDRAAVAAETLARYRRADGGYAKSPQSGHSSTYHTFLAAACLELVGIPPEDADRTAELVLARRRDDGGFVELPPLGQSGTNPTAAAVGLLRLLDRLDEPTRRRAAGFLAAMQSPEGGLRANTRIPAADLLSTFTGLVALADLDSLQSVDLPAAGRYVQSLARPGGGFRGGAWDDAADVEYTFYGLGTLALLV
jgi:geranylgeranyl transferase type-2 subunit beta